MPIVELQEFKDKLTALGKDKLIPVSVTNDMIETLIADSEEVVKVDLNLSELPDESIYKTLVTYYTIHVIATGAIIDKESKSSFGEQYDRLVAKLRTPAFGISVVDMVEEEEA